MYIYVLIYAYISFHVYILHLYGYLRKVNVLKCISKIRVHI